MALFLAGSAVFGFETDQFMTWSVELEDSAPAINEFVNQRFESTLERINRRPRAVPCQDVTRLLYQDLVGTLVASRLRRFLHDSELIDRFPNNEISYWQYRKQSVFRRRAFPILLPMSRTVRVGDVYVGADKFGHFFGFGRRYYKRYVAARRTGESEQEALRRAVLWGLRMERTMVGGWADGIVSHADLEANYQGMAMAIAMCEGPSPMLERQDSGDYRLSRRIDMRDWITLNLDGSWNVNHYMYYRWRLVRPILQQEVCPRRNGAVVRARFERYQEIAHASPAMNIIEQFYTEWGTSNSSIQNGEEDHRTAIRWRTSAPALRNCHHEKRYSSGCSVVSIRELVPMPLNISYFHYLFGDDTALNHVRQFSEAARGLGHRVDVGALNLANPEPGSSTSPVEAGTGHGRRSLAHRMLSRYLHEPKELLWNLRYAKLERRLLTEKRPDVLIVRDNLWSISYLGAARALGIPVVLEVNAPARELGLYHDQYFHLPALIPNRLERYRLHNANRIAAVSTPLRDHLLARIAPNKKADIERISVIPNGVDPERFGPKAAVAALGEQDDGLPASFDNQPVIGFVGSFQAFHGPELLAAMTLGVAEKNSAARFLFVGDGPGLDLVRRRVQYLGNRVHFTGSVEHRHVPDLTRRIDIGVLPDTAFYCSPLKVLEWMASEVAIVAPDYPCLEDILEPDQEALLFEPRVNRSLVDAVLSLLDDPGRRQELGRAARARATSQLTWRHNAEKVVELCHEAIESESGS